MLATCFHQHLVNTIDAHQNELSVLRETARKIIRMGARKALNICLRDGEAADLEHEAQSFLDHDGEDGGAFETLLNTLSNPVGEGSEEDQFWRESAYAERSMAA